MVVCWDGCPFDRLRVNGMGVRRRWRGSSWEGVTFNLAFPG